MFTTLGRIFGTNRPRQTENADARMDIRRHDPDDQRGQKDKPETQDDGQLHEDSATVSVEALRSFFVNFLQILDEQERKKTGDENGNTGAVPSPAEAAPEPTPAATPQTAQAVNAYQSAARSAEPPTTELHGDNAAEAAESLGLTGAERRTINDLIKDLELLETRAVEFIVIESTGVTFLQSIANAVAHAKAISEFQAP